MEFTTEQLIAIIAAVDDLNEALEEDRKSGLINGKVVARWDFLNDHAAPPEVVKRLAEIALASLEAEPVVITDDMAYAFHHALSDSSLGADEVEEIKTGLRAAFANVTAPPAPVSVPETLPCPVLLEPGLRFGKGVKTKTMLEALQRRAEYNADLDAMTLEQREQHDAGMREFAAMLQGADGKPELTVWYGAMPETNGKTNWTAILHRKGEHLPTGITIDRSEYPERVRYEADRVRYLIGESDKRPCIIDYDANAHSGYVEPVTTAYKLPPHVYRELVNALRDTAVKYQGCQQLREQISETLSAVITHTPHGNNPPVIPDQVLSAVRKVARIRADFDDFDGDRRGIGDCLDEAEQELIVTINKYASVIAAAPQQEVKVKPKK